MSESSIKKLRSENKRLEGRLSIATDKEIKLLDSLLEMQAQLGEALRKIEELENEKNSTSIS